MPRNEKLYTYKGKTQNISQWSRELGLGPVTLHARLRSGMSFEEAVTKKFNTKTSVYIEAWGQKKSAEQWALDPRCKVSAATLSRRLKSGQYKSVEEAIETAPLRQTRTDHGEKLEAFGVQRTISQWAKHLGVPKSRIHNRVHRAGLPLEEVLRDLGFDESNA
ncbi:hypothetical protein [Streptomyces sp. CoH17]|uniref:hypothetical protein n=1 Tax=Streptomyces sp. CoH17 TaxID=2992806 RepID=UPI00226D6E3F|nr:hypothetical protein [Streptomyces sp. CoH17]